MSFGVYINDYMGIRQLYYVDKCFSRAKAENFVKFIVHIEDTVASGDA